MSRLKVTVNVGQKAQPIEASSVLISTKARDFVFGVDNNGELHISVYDGRLAMIPAASNRVNLGLLK